MAKKYNSTARDIKRKLQQVEKYILQLNQPDVPPGVAHGCRKTGAIMVFGDFRITDVLLWHTQKKSFQVKRGSIARKQCELAPSFYLGSQSLGMS